MKYEYWFVIGVSLVSTACLIELNPDFIEAVEDYAVGESESESEGESETETGAPIESETETETGSETEEEAERGEPRVLYGPCPSGDNDECTSPQFCVTGRRHGIYWSLCTTPCANNSECVVDELDECADLPGDGWHKLRCAPLIRCGSSDPCPRDMLCAQGIMADAPSVCVWPNP